MLLTLTLWQYSRPLAVCLAVSERGLASEFITLVAVVGDPGGVGESVSGVAPSVVDLPRGPTVSGWQKKQI